MMIILIKTMRKSDCGQVILWKLSKLSQQDKQKGTVVRTDKNVGKAEIMLNKLFTNNSRRCIQYDESGHHQNTFERRWQKQQWHRPVRSIQHMSLFQAAYAKPKSRWKIWDEKKKTKHINRDKFPLVKLTIHSVKLNSIMRFKLFAYFQK